MAEPTNTNRYLGPRGVEPPLPRRVFFAALLSAGLAAAGGYLAWQGSLGAPWAEDFSFTRGTAFAPGERNRLREFLLIAARDSRLDLRIVGHSGTIGDAAANQELSESRASLVETIAREMGINADRMTVIGMGGAAPLSRMTGETDRAWQGRLARVEVTLQVRR